MPRAVALFLVVAAILAAPASALAAPDEAPRLRAVVSSCQTGGDPAMRSASFTASMPADAGTVRMAIRFELQERTIDGGVWRRLAAPSFNRWERSRAGVAGFVYAKDVHGLTAPGEYRAVVRFRWFAQDGTVRNVRKVTKSCHQPDQRASLVTGPLQALPAADPAQVTYRIPVRNTAKAPAGPFAVTIALDGVEVGRTTVAGLAPGAATTVQITARPMPVERLTAVATLDRP